MSRVPSSILLILPKRTCARYATLFLPFSLFFFPITPRHSATRFPFLFHVPHLSLRSSLLFRRCIVSAAHGFVTARFVERSDACTRTYSDTTGDFNRTLSTRVTPTCGGARACRGTLDLRHANESPLFGPKPTTCRAASRGRDTRIRTRQYFHAPSIAYTAIPMRKTTSRTLARYI